MCPASAAAGGARFGARASLMQHSHSQESVPQQSGADGSLFYTQMTSESVWRWKWSGAAVLVSDLLVDLHSNQLWPSRSGEHACAAVAGYLLLRPQSEMAL